MRLESAAVVSGVAGGEGGVGGGGGVAGVDKIKHFELVILEQFQVAQAEAESNGSQLKHLQLDQSETASN